MDKEIRQEIRVEMARRGVSQRELARRLGVTPSALSQVVSGTRGTIPQSLLDVLAALGLTLKAVPADAPPPSSSASSAEGKKRQDAERQEPDPAATSPEQNAEAEA